MHANTSTHAWGGSGGKVRVIYYFCGCVGQNYICEPLYHTPHFYSLEESGVLTDCSIQTQDADEILEFDFCSANVVNKVIMSAECLKEVFAELDMSSEALEILLSPSSPYCRLSTSGYAGTTQVSGSVYDDQKTRVDSE